MKLESPAHAADLLAKNEVVALPTETVYGLAGRYDSPDAVELIFKTKARPSFDPLIVHVLNSKQAKSLTTTWPDAAESLTQEYWPGPLTLVLPKNEKVSDSITAGLPTVALRSPKHPMFQEVLRTLGIPLAAPSANRFGKTSPTTAEHVEDEFGEEMPVLDGGACPIGLESSVVAIDADGLKLLRPGAITKEMLQKTSGLNVTTMERQDSPGHLKSHYQPAAPLYLESQTGLPELVLNEDPAIAARELYGKLREQSQQSPEGFYVLKQRYPQDGLWRAIWDRLGRASKKQ